MIIFSQTRKMPNDDGEWLRHDHPRAVAVEYLHIWYTAVQLQAARVAERPHGGLVRIADAHQFIHAVCQLRRTAKFAHCSCQGETCLAIVRDAIEKSDHACEGLKNARDQLEHFDEYERGRGRITLPDPPQGDRFVVAMVGSDPDRLVVGGSSLSVDACTRASRALYEQAYAALRGDV